MKFIFKDPIEWAEKAVGPNIKFYLMLFWHILAGVLLITMPKLRENIVFLVIFVTIFPLFYLYIMRRLLIMLKDK